MTAPKREAGCIFCDAADSPPERHRELGLLLAAGPLLVITNKFPYNNGHVMIFPRRHVASFVEFTPEELARLGEIVAAAERILREHYHPHGLNVGVNVGEAAGAGIAAHLHVHVLPRWSGDTNFMTTAAETRVVPETNEAVWDRIHEAFAALSQG